MAELVAVLLLYYAWVSVPRGLQRDILTWVWAVLLAGAGASLFYTLVTTGSLPSPPTG